MKLSSVLERRDFGAEARIVVISALAIVIGALCTGVAVVLLRLIDLFTNLFFYQQFSLTPRSPADHALGGFVVIIPAIGGLLVGLVARFGSEKIRGHGIPEAMEAILIGQSRMQPKVAALKPLSSAIAIGSGGPFGAEGPIIMTGGAFGSLIAQLFHLTAAERKTLLVAGAAGGMAAIFAAPVAAVLLAVELLLFELRPRSLVPVALASAVAALIRPYLFGAGPFFAVPLHAAPPTTPVLLSSIAVGLLAGILSLLVTAALYGIEDLFHRLPIHWMWWPALGGLAVGLGGWFQPKALGVGYEIIEGLLRGEYVAHALIGLLVVKTLIWALALGSGTSGGVLAPLLIIGGILGALESTFLPGGDKALWPLVSMAAVLGGTMRAPLMATIFALELTNDIHALLPLLVASMVSYALAASIMRHSILTEKVARRGYPISHEYAVDPLERLSVGQVMISDVVSVPASLPVGDLIRNYFFAVGPHKHPAYPIVGKNGKFLGLVTQSSLLEHWVTGLLSGSGTNGGADPFAASPIIAYDLVEHGPVTVSPCESCRVAAERMARAGVKRLPVVAADDPHRLVGMVTLGDLLKARQRLLEEEVHRERFLFGPAAAPHA